MLGASHWKFPQRACPGLTWGILFLASVPTSIEADQPPAGEGAQQGARGGKEGGRDRGTRSL